LRASFLTGLVVVLPIGLTIYLIWTVIGWIDGWILPLIPGPWKPEVLVRQYFGPDATIPVRGVGVVVFLVFTVFVGWIAKGLLGRSLLSWAEGLVDRMPVVRSIYNGIKQIAETVFAQTETNFERACLVEYPKEDIWAIGFVSTRAKGELQAKLNKKGYENVVSVFLPTTPNPTSGFLLYVSEADITYLDMKIEDAAKLIISAGLVYPNGKDGANGKEGGIRVQNPSAEKG
jgi:uncharacterized membrane protein